MRSNVTEVQELIFDYIERSLLQYKHLPHGKECGKLIDETIGRILYEIKLMLDKPIGVVQMSNGFYCTFLRSKTDDELQRDYDEKHGTPQD